MAQLLGHEAHRPVDVVEEGLEARTEVVEAGLAFGVVVKRSLEQPPWPYFALEAVTRQRLALVEPDCCCWAIFITAGTSPMCVIRMFPSF